MDIIAGTPYEHLDPSTTLSQLDVVNLLTLYCNKVVNSGLKSERNDIDEIIKKYYMYYSFEKFIHFNNLHKTYGYPVQP